MLCCRTFAVGHITARIAYNGFGNALGGVFGVVNQPPTKIQFTGQWFDPIIQRYNMRARIYNPVTGLFDSRDPNFGDLSNPLTFQTFLYSLQDPTNRFDPNGLASNFMALLGTAIHQYIYGLYAADPINAGHTVHYGLMIPGTLGKVLPDIADLTVKQIGEIKPLSESGLLKGAFQLGAYVSIANGFSTTYGANTWKLNPWLGGGWSPSTWPVGIRPVFPGSINHKLFSDWIAFTIGNANGLILYKAFNIRSVGAPIAYAFATVLADRLDVLVEAYLESIPITIDTLPAINLELDYIVYGIGAVAASKLLINAAPAIGSAVLSVYEGIASMLADFGFA